MSDGTPYVAMSDDQDGDRSEIPAPLAEGEGVLVPDAIRALNLFFGGTEYPTPGECAEMMRQLRELGGE